MQAAEFAHLDETVRDRYVDPSSKYSFGWSLGKEMFAGKPGKCMRDMFDGETGTDDFYTDMFKGSYYAHPTLDKREIDDKELQAKYAMYFADNVWPSQADCPQYEMAFKELAAFMVDVGIKLAKALDALGASHCGALCLRLNPDVYSRAQRFTPSMRY